MVWVSQSGYVGWGWERHSENPVNVIPLSSTIIPLIVQWPLGMPKKIENYFFYTAHVAALVLLIHDFGWFILSVFGMAILKLKLKWKIKYVWEGGRRRYRFDVISHPYPLRWTLLATHVVNMVASSNWGQTDLHLWNGRWALLCKAGVVQ